MLSSPGHRHSRVQTNTDTQWSPRVQEPQGSSEQGSHGPAWDAAAWPGPPGAQSGVRDSAPDLRHPRWHAGTPGLRAHHGGVVLLQGGGPNGPAQQPPVPHGVLLPLEALVQQLAVQQEQLVPQGAGLVRGRGAWF